MPDFFSLFNLPRRPSLDVDALKEEFHRQSAALHPDAGGDAARFAQWNTAYQALREPAARLRHLLELEAPALLAASPQIPPAFGEHFMRSASVQQSAGTFLAKYRGVSSPLSRALLAGDAAAQTQRLDVVLGELEAAQTTALEELRALDDDWRDHLEEVARLHAALSYLNKWTVQLRETRLQFDLMASTPKFS
jgi:DnaJ-domain-containing protein 1